MSNAARPGRLPTFPGLAGMPAEDRKSLAEHAEVVRLPAGVRPFRPGEPCQHFIIVADGVVRVQMVSETGREIVLYRVEAGETCILTMSCLFSGEDYAAEAVTETEVEAVLVPTPAFQRLIDASAAFRRFVFESYGRRLADLMLVVEEVAFRRIDVRLAALLLSRARVDPQIRLTHQELAVELGSAREVISRQLKEFERLGAVVLQRGRIAVVDDAPLRTLASADR